jgi:hypothetical protein
MGELGDDSLDIWLEADVRPAFSITWYFIDFSYGITARGGPDRRLIHTYTSSRSIDSLVHWQVELYSPPRSDTYPVCSPATIGG